MHAKSVKFMIKILTADTNIYREKFTLQFCHLLPVFLHQRLSSSILLSSSLLTQNWNAFDNGRNRSSNPTVILLSTESRASDNPDQI